MKLSTIKDSVIGVSVRVVMVVIALIAILFLGALISFLSNIAVLLFGNQFIGLGIIVLGACALWELSDNA